MSNANWPPSSGNQQDSIAYYGQPPDNSDTLLRLAVIFNYISMALDAISALLCGGFGLVVLAMPESFPQRPGELPPWVGGLIYLAMGVFVFLPIVIFKIIAIRKVQNRSPGVWGWGLALGIVGCSQAICGSCCCLQVVPGIYTLVVFCLGGVRARLAAGAQQAQGN